MQKRNKTNSRKTLLFCFTILGMIAAFIVVPYQFSSKAGNEIKTGKGLIERTESHQDGLKNYDIRSDKKAVNTIDSFRQSLNTNAVEVADIRDEFVQGEETLRQRVPSLKVEYNNDIRIPEVIAPKVGINTEYLSSASSRKRSEILRNFIQQNNNLVGVEDDQAENLIVTADYTNPDGNLSFASLEQRINGIPVFRGEIKAGFTKSGEMIRVINNLAPGLNYSSLSTDFGDPVNAVNAAAGHINYEPKAEDLNRNDAISNDLKVVFGEGDFSTSAEKMYFPTEPGVARPAWRVLIWQPVSAYYIIVDAETGTMLWRKNITEDQTQSATYSVYANPNAMVNVADNPFPYTPGPTVLSGAQGTGIPRTTITRVGNETPYTFNNNGWITNGGDRTSGNSVQAGLDRAAPDGIDTNGEAINSGRNFSYAYAPGDPNTNTGDAPVPTTQVYPGSNYQQGAVTQLFYICNWYHDETYRLGFTEAANNFQLNNFGRGGTGNDHLSAQAQDYSGTDNANFSTPSDGGRGRMQMYVFVGPNPDFDGDLDADIVIHEFTHGLSNRLHGNATGLSSDMARGMGEGWGDFYGHAMLSESSDPINGIYVNGGYATYRLFSSYITNYFYGIRRFPKAVMAATGGLNNRPFNPLTFADVDVTQINLNDGAFSRGPIGSSTSDQVHNAGEIWSSALWEARGKVVTRIGWADGNRAMLQSVTDGMKLSPLSPTFLQGRDSIIVAAQAAYGAGVVSDIWEGFRIRGMGFSAMVINEGSGDNTARVTEAFDPPNVQFVQPGFSVSDLPGDGDGFPEPGEKVLLSIPVVNNTGVTVNNVAVNVNGGSNVSYGNLSNAQTVTRQIPFTIPTGTPCGETITVTANISSSVGSYSQTFSFRVTGQPLFAGTTQNFDGVTAPALPAGWLQENSGNNTGWVTSSTLATSAPNAAYGPAPDLPGLADLNASAKITSASAQLSFKIFYNTETTWDGTVLDIQIGNGAYQDIIAAGGSFSSGGYNNSIRDISGTVISGRAAWTGSSAAFINTVVNLPASANGQTINLRWRTASDANTTASGTPGTIIDDVVLTGGTLRNGFECSVVNAPRRSRADFDGDGKTDLSVFRPSGGDWYLNGSTNGFSVIHWGISTDVLVPGDYDGDGKTDTATFRANDTAGISDFYILNSNGFTLTGLEWGSTGDIPVVGDYDGDDSTDVAVFRPSTGSWFILKSGGGATITTFGQNGDVPVAGDFDGDGNSDLTVYRNGQWISQPSGGAAVTTKSFGLAGDILTPADYDGDNIDDIAVFRPSNGVWYILKTTGGGAATFVQFGQNGDVPAPGDYDGDGSYDIAIYRNGIWYINASTSGTSVFSFGLSSDRPIPKQYVP